MTLNKRTKNSRQRGSHTHGWGSMKKHRGAGSRGGRGNSGSGKRGDQKKPCFWKKKYFGKDGFISKSRAPEMITVNIKNIIDLIPTWENKGLISKKGDSYTIGLEKLGYNKLLATGKCSLKLNITVDYASSNAIEKVKKAGGNVEVVEGDVFEAPADTTEEPLTEAEESA